LRQAITDHGAFDYILKPFKRNELLNSIQNAFLKRDFSYQKKLREKELQERILQLEKEFHERTHQLRESQIKYKDIVENSNDAIVVVQDGKLKFANTQTVELTGYPQEELKDMSFLEMVHPEDRNMVEESYKREDFPSIFFFRALKKSGEPLFVENNAVRTTWEKRQATLNIIRDVTEHKKTEDALKASQDYARNIIDSSLDMIITVDIDRYIVEFNKAAEETFGYCREELVGTLVDILYANPEEGLAVHKKTVEQDQCVQEILNRRKNGKVFPSFLSASLLRNPRGEMVGVMGVSRDITEHKYAEEALQKSEEKYRSLINDVLDSSATGIFILDSDFRVVWMNRALEDYFDLKRDDIIGKDKRQLIRERIKDTFENPDSFAHTVFTTYDDNTYIERFECHVLPDGTREERWLEHQSQPIQSGLYAGGRIEHYYNITARKQAEENLRKSEEKYRSLFEDSKDAIYITRRDGKFLDVNPALLELFEYSREEMIDKLNVEEIYMYLGDRDTFQKEIEKNGSVRDYEVKFCKKNGTEMDCLLTSTVRRSNEGSILGYQGIIRDITARKQAEKKLTASLKEKEILLKEVHHRVKNNMQVISSMLSLQSQHITDKASLEMFQESQNRIRSMALIHEKLYTSEDLAHIDIASYIHSLTHQLITTYHTLASRVNMDIAITDIFLTITTAIPCGLIINELVTNALKHAFPHQQKGTITVSMTPSTNDHLILTVSDTGIGFPEGIDFRNTTTLGMQLVTSLVEQLEGTITLDRSEGTTFTITFRGGGTV